MRYPIFITQVDEETFEVVFPDFEGYATEGDTLEEAQYEAQNLITQIVGVYQGEGRELPKPSDISEPEEPTILSFVNA